MNLFYLRYFVQLAHTQHYTKAAKELNITQPSLSHAITQLEKELGVPLFEKNGRNTTLTRFGEEFLSCAEHTLAVLDGGVSSLKRSSRGEGLIRLGFLNNLGERYIPGLAARFLKKYPDREIHFTFHSGSTRVLLDGLAKRKYDLVFSSGPPAEEGFAAVPVKKQDLVLITPHDHPLADRYNIDLAETAPYPHIWFAKDAGLRVLVDQMYKDVGVSPRIAYETEEDRVIAGLVAKGFGIAVVPYMDILLKLDVRILQISNPVVDRLFYMVHDPRIYMPPVVKDFREFVLEESELKNNRKP